MLVIDPTYQDPMKFKALCWPDVTFFREQRMIIRSVVENQETYVPAGNKLGKDFVAGFIALWDFIAHPVVRVITTSVKDDHLRVLWGEIGRYILSSRVALLADRGGCLVVNHRDIRKVLNGERCPISYLRGMVSERGEGLSGHHAPHTLLIVDEASGVDDAVYAAGQGWMKRLLVIGNPNPCSNFFFRGVEAGDKAATSNSHLFRKVIRVCADDSPNVRLGRAQIARGRKPTDEIIVPGVLTYGECLDRRENWDAVRQCIGLDAAFYKGAEVLLFPPEWLNLAEQRARLLAGVKRVAKAIGIDPGEGVAHTADYVVDELGIIERVSVKTPDTSTIPGRAIALMMKHHVSPENVLFDRGGGGKQHADYLRARGYNVRTVGFGEAATPEIRRGMKPLEQRKGEAEVRYAFKNRRAEMYWMLRQRLDPSANGPLFAIPAECVELRRQLAPIPLLYDPEGRLYLPPKNKRSPGSTEATMTDLIGCSPDEADALVLAVFGLKDSHRGVMVGAVRL